MSFLQPSLMEMRNGNLHLHPPVTGADSCEHQEVASSPSSMAAQNSVGSWGKEWTQQSHWKSKCELMRRLFSMETSLSADMGLVVCISGCLG